MSKKKVIIIGAAGFVGIELVSQLQNENYELYAFTRDNGSFLLEGMKITHVKSDNISTYAPFDVVVNLAYPTTSKLHTFPQVNQSILNTLKQVVSSKTKIIHVSTQALFGFGMDHEVINDFLKNRRDFAYIEAKLQMENLINSTFSNNTLSIVRLGNVWGPGSGTWTGALAEKLVFGKFIALKNVDGFSNITDVKNVASYIIHLIKSEKLNKRNIFHLSEFSNIKWSKLIDFMSKELGVKPIYSDVKPSYSVTLWNDLSPVLKLPSIGDTYRELIWGRFSGSLLRSLLRFLGSERFQKIKKTEVKYIPVTQVLDRSDLVYLNVVASTVEFKSILLDDWNPPIDIEKSLELVREWMKDVGYIN